MFFEEADKGAQAVKRAWNEAIQHHMEEQLTLYVFTTVLFIMGVVFGSLIVGTLSVEQRQDLSGYLQHFFNSLEQGTLAEPAVALKHAVLHHLKYIALMWVLGLTIVGAPLVLVLIFLKGLVIGFTVGFFVRELAWQGLGFAFLSVFPQNLLIIPALIIVSVASIGFSLLLLRNRFIQRRGTIYPQFATYSFSVLVMACVLVFASFFEAYVSPKLMQMAAVQSGIFWTIAP